MACPTFTKSKTFRISAGLVLLLIIGGISYGLLQFNKKHSNLNKVKPEFVLGSADLYSEFDKDETAATAKFINKVIEVSGNVAELEFGSSDSTLSITLRPDDKFSGVICTFPSIKNQASVNVKKGDQISVRGECSGMMMDVLLNNCVIVKRIIRSD
jgi:hypothetical protein